MMHFKRRSRLFPNKLTRGVREVREADLTRRTLLIGSACAGLMAAAPQRLSAGTSALREWRLVAAPGRAVLVGDADPRTDVWTYDGAVPGPEIRVRQGDRLRVIVDNGLPQETTVHWHGVRVPNAMDGVPYLTQKPIAPGETFVYEFDCLDAGTFWYHPHVRSFEQVERGLAGALIVEETKPLNADRDIAANGIFLQHGLPLCRARD